MPVRNYAVERNRVFEALFQRPAEPQRLGRYAVLGTLGHGGMGTVLKAYDEGLDRAVAVKLLRPEMTERHALRLKREAQALAKLSHPNVVHVYEVGRADGQWFIAMEMVRGQTLRQWQNEGHGWRECVDVYLRAGAGLAAAHIAGLVHRDFKPDNCIIDKRRRPRILDFGLVREIDESPDDESSAILPVPRADTSNTFLTRTGTVLGTPAYMPPEQMKGQRVDARSDQFSFCVSLYEGLYGERPFAGDSMAQLSVALMTGEVRPPPKGTRVPGKLRRVLLRGLSVEPENRWPTMDTMLEEMQRIVAPVRIRLSALVVSVGVVAVGMVAVGMGLWQQTKVMPHCLESEVLVGELWGEEHRQRINTALLATGRNYAIDTVERVTEHLDTYAQTWADGYVDACEANRIRGEQSAEAFDLRMACLGRQRTELETTVEALTSEVSVNTLRRAVEMVTALPDPQVCADVEALRTRGRPSDPADVAEVERLHRSLARASVLSRAGRNGEAGTLARDVETHGIVLGDPALLGEARLLQGRMLGDVHQFSEAETVLRSGFGNAVEGRDATLAVETAMELSTLMGVLQARTSEAEHWVDQASAWLRGVDEQDPRFARLWLIQGGIHQVAGRLDEARRAFTQAVAMLQTHPETADLAEVHHTLGLALAAIGELDEAERQFSSEVNLREDLLGSQHPEVAVALRSLGVTFYASGQLPLALPPLERALKIQEAALGPDHPQVAVTLDNLGSLKDDLGEHEEARGLLQRALKILEFSGGANSIAMTRLRSNLAEVLHRLGEHVAAMGHLRWAAEVVESEHGAAHPERLYLLTRLAGIQLEIGKLDEARDLLEEANALRDGLPQDSALMSADIVRGLAHVRHSQGQYAKAQALLLEAIEVYRSLGPALDPHRGEALSELGAMQLANGDPAAARGSLELAIPLLTTIEAPSEVLASARFSFARALMDDGNVDGQAYKMAELAFHAYADLGEPYETHLAEVQAWLDTHATPPTR